METFFLTLFAINKAMLKNVFTLNILLLCVIFVFSCQKKNSNDNEYDVQTQQLFFSFESAKDDYANVIIQASDGNFIIAGETYTNAKGKSDAWVFKVNERGTIEWEKKIGGYGVHRREGINSIVETADGELILAGFTETKGSKYMDRDAWLLKIDENGNLLWDKNFNNSTDDQINSLIQTKNGNYIMVGYTKERGNKYGWLLKTDENGSLEWDTVIQRGEINSIVQTYDQGYLLLKNSFLIKVDQNGNKLWHQSIGGNNIIHTSDGNFVLSTTFNYYNRDIKIIKITPEGEVIWERTFGGESTSDKSYSIIESGNGNYAIAGYTRYNAWIILLDSEGTLIWDKSIESGDSNEAKCITQTREGGYAIIGNSIKEKQSDAWMIIISKDEIMQ